VPFTDAYYSFSQVFYLRLGIRYSKMGGSVNLNFGGNGIQKKAKYDIILKAVQKYG